MNIPFDCPKSTNPNFEYEAPGIHAPPPSINKKNNKPSEMETDGIDGNGILRLISNLASSGDVSPSPAPDNSDIAMLDRLPQNIRVEDSEQTEMQQDQ